MSLFLKISSKNLTFGMLISVLMILSCQNLVVSSFEYQVGEKQGWVVPLFNANETYNDWASQKRFQVGDTIRFKYKKDSVMEVTGEDYKDCNSTLPKHFSNTGNSVFKLDHTGPFYFISGMSGHCEKGQKVIIKVISENEDKKDKKSGSSSVSPVVVLPISVCLVLFIHSVL